MVSDDDYSLMILKNRLAKGEITVEEFNTLKKTLLENNSLEEIKTETIKKNQEIIKIPYDDNQNKIMSLPQSIMEEIKDPFEYDCKYVNGHSKYKESMKGMLSLNRAKKKSSIVFSSKNENFKIVMPITSLENSEIVSLTRGFFKKEDKMIRLRFVDESGKTQMPVFNVDNAIADDVLNTIIRLKDELIEPIIHSFKSRGIVKHVMLDLSSPQMHFGEAILWSQKEEDKKSYRNISKVVTNYRVFVYDNEDETMKQHISLADVDDVVVVDRHFDSKSHGTSYIVGGYGDHVFGGIVPSKSQSQSKSIGDVVFMRQGKPYIVISQLPDPDGVVSMIKSVMNELYPRFGNIT